jgi:hypothetical protein
MQIIVSDTLRHVSNVAVVPTLPYCHIADGPLRDHLIHDAWSTSRPVSDVDYPPTHGEGQVANCQVFVVSS